MTDEIQSDSAEPHTTDGPASRGDEQVDTDDASRAAPSADEATTLRRQRDEYRDLLLRKTAEFDNYRKRVDRERRELAEFAAADLIEAVLPFIDDLERALEVEPGADGAQAYRDGVKLIHQRLLDLLAKRGVTPIAAVGREFDPHVHQAVEQVASPGHRDGEVIAELRRGYTLRGRLLRAAMVRVAKS